MDIKINTEATAVAQSLGIDVVAVCNDAVANAIRSAVLQDSERASFLSRRDALEAVEPTLSKLRPTEAEAVEVPLGTKR